MSAHLQKKTIWLVVLACLFLLTAASDVPAQPEQELDDDGQEKAVMTPVQKRMLNRVSVDFRETPIEDVLRSMAQQVDVDIIKSPDVVGNVTATLTDVPLDEALTNILSAHGYAYIPSENMIRVVPIGQIAQVEQKRVNRVYRITYADVEEVYQALRGFITKDGDIAFNKGTSNLMVTETERRIEAIDTFVKEVDRITAQIMVEARIYDITSSDSLDLGIQWTLGRNTTFTNGINALGGVTGTTDPFITGAISGVTDQASGIDALLRFGILNSSLNIDAIIRAEQEEVSAKLLANPRIMVLDNKEAMIKIVEEIPFQELTETAQAGQIGTTEFREVGVELRVIPHVTRDGMIRLSLNPSFSVNTGEVVIPGTNLRTPQPIVATREALTTALIRDGQTVVIGGLRKQDILKQQTKVPLLGDMPLVGGLFKFEGESTVNNELVVFITPHIVEEPVLTQAECQALKETQVPTPPTPFTRIHRNKEEKCGRDSCIPPQR